MRSRIALAIKHKAKEQSKCYSLAGGVHFLNGLPDKGL